jgi:hypothetical protein
MPHRAFDREDAPPLCTSIREILFCSLQISCHNPVYYCGEQEIASQLYHGRIDSVAARLFWSDSWSLKMGVQCFVFCIVYGKCDSNIKNHVKPQYIWSPCRDSNPESLHARVKCSYRTLVTVSAFRPIDCIQTIVVWFCPLWATLLMRFACFVTYKFILWWVGFGEIGLRCQSAYFISETTERISFKFSMLSQRG